MTHSRVLCVPALLIALFGFAGCGKKQSAAPASGNEAAGGSTADKVLRYGNGTEPQELDPQVVTGVPEHNIIATLFEGLVSENPKDLHPEPAMAESWDISPDKLVYTFHLRANLKWSNGEPLAASDLVASFKRMLTPSLAAEYSYLLWFVDGAEDFNNGKLTDFSKVGFSAPDERTFVVKLRSPTPFLLKLMAGHYTWWPVPVKEIARYGDVAAKGVPWTQPGRLVGNGPFILKEWVPNQRITVVRNPNYWDAARVRLDAVEFYPTENSSAEEAMFRTGQIDKTNELPLSKIDTYRKQYPEALHIEPYLGIYFYRFNVTRPPLNDKRVRKALALAIDREAIVKSITRGGQTPAYAVSYPGVEGYSPRAHLEGGVEEAKRLLAEAGFPGGKGFPHIELLYNTSEGHRAIAEAIQQMWRTNLGIDIGLLNQEWKVYLNTQHMGDYWICRAGWIADYVDPNVFLEIWTTGNGNNNTGWSNAEYDRLARAALQAPSEQERYEIYQKMDAILVDECPVLPIYYYKRVYAMTPKVTGWYPTLLDNHPFKYIDIKR